MKKIFLFPFLLFSICLMGQSQFEKTYFSQAYNDTFKNESVVIVRMMDEAHIRPMELMITKSMLYSEPSIY
jgi:hypothetical protein